MAEAGSEQQDTLDLSRQGLKKLNKAQPQDAQGVSSLILDGNELQRWDNIDSYSGLRKLSAAHNQLLRMYGVSRLHHLCSLNLAHNSILTIEGVKDLLHLKWLCLAANNIKTIEHLQTNVNLEYLDLSDNNIAHISDLSFLKNLKQLFLHGNRISQLRQCERHVPAGLATFTLAANNIGDLNEMSHLVHLTSLREFSITGNPCVNMTSNCVGFDYRPFVINWCMSLKVIDGFVVDAIESLKAEWLYSQGRGRQFRVGEHQALIQYLAGVCPLTADSLQSEEERKLRLILSKAQQHQQQLREQVTINGTARGRGAVLNRSQSSPAPSPATRRRISTYRNTSPRRANLVRDCNSKANIPVPERGKSPDNMVVSCQGIPVTSGESEVPTLMTQSLDPVLLFNSANQHKESNGSDQSVNSSSLVVEDFISEGSVTGSNCPLQAATKLVPVPESLMSPDYRPVNPVVNRVARPRSSTVGNNNGQPLRGGNSSLRGSPKLCRSLHSSPRARTRSMIEPRQVSAAHAVVEQAAVAASTQASARKRCNVQGRHHDANSSDEDSEMSASKLETIRHRAQERWQRKETAPAVVAPPSNSEHAAVCIQRMWRGYHTRNLNEEVQAVYRKIQDSRTQQYIQKLSSDMEATRAALESDRKLHLLKMQAINAIWKKVLSMQPSSGKEDGLASSNPADTDAIRELTQTCSLLHSQVEQLQGSMQNMMQCMSMFCQPPGSSQHQMQPRATSTQTDIVAVTTPQGDGVPFPYQRAGSRTRPSSLPILQRARNPDTDAPQELKQFATSLVDGVLRTVAGEEAVTGGTSDGDTSAPTLEDIANGCATSADAAPDLPEVETDSVSNGNATVEDEEVTAEEQDPQQNILNLEETPSNIVLSKEPQSPPRSPFEPDSPNNNQRAQALENGMLAP